MPENWRIHLNKPNAKALPQGAVEKVEISMLTDAAVAELKNATANGTQIGVLKLVDNEGISNLSLASLTELMTMILEKKIGKVDLGDATFLFPAPASKDASFDYMLKRCEYAVKEHHVPHTNPPVAETGVFYFKGGAAQTAKAIVLSEVIGNKTFYPKRFYRRNPLVTETIGGIAYGPHNSLYPSPPPIDFIAVTEHGPCFRIPVDANFSRDALVQFGFERPKMRRRQDNSGRNYILVTETEVDRVLGIAKSQEKSAGR